MFSCYGHRNKIYIYNIYIIKFMSYENPFQDKSICIFFYCCCCCCCYCCCYRLQSYIQMNPCVCCHHGNNLTFTLLKTTLNHLCLTLSPQHCNHKCITSPHTPYIAITNCMIRSITCHVILTSSPIMGCSQMINVLWDCSPSHLDHLRSIPSLPTTPISLQLAYSAPR